MTSMQIVSNKNLLIATTIVCMITGSCILLSNIMMGIVIMAMPLFLMTTIHFPGIVLLTVLAFRPAIDLVTDRSIIRGLNASSLIAILIICITIFELFYKKNIIPEKTMVIFFLFILSTIPSFMVTKDFVESISVFIRYISFLCVYIIVYSYIMNGLLKKEGVIGAIVFSSILPVFKGLVQWVTKTGKSDVNVANRIYGTFVNPNVYAFYLVIIIATVFIALLKAKTSLKPVYTLLLMLCIASIFMTSTRGAWLGLAVFLLITVFFSKMKSHLKLSILLICIVLSFVFMNHTISRFAGVFDARMETSSLATRLHIWRHVIRYFFRSPIVGNGLGSLASISRISCGLNLDAHNDYIKLLVETGVSGTIPYLSLIIYCSVKLTKRLFRERSRNELLIITALFISFAIMSLGDNIINMTVTQWYIWSLVAVADASLWEVSAANVELE